MTTGKCIHDMDPRACELCNPKPGRVAHVAPFYPRQTKRVRRTRHAPPPEWTTDARQAKMEVTHG